MEETTKPQRQYVWIVRYGLTEHPLVEDLGPYDSDIDPNEGIEHAKSIAKRIAGGIHNDGPDGESDSVPKFVYTSPFLRTAHTGYIVANELQQQQQQQQQQSETKEPKVELRFEEGLWEWLIPSLLVTKADGIKTNPMDVDSLAAKLCELENTAPDNNDKNASIVVDYPDVNPYDDSGDEGLTCVPERMVDPDLVENSSEKNVSDHPAIGGNRRPRWIESEADLLERCETTLNGLLENHADTGASLCIVSHAPCDQAMAFSMETGAATPGESELTPWPLGGITVFSRPIIVRSGGDDGIEYGEWTMDMYGNTEHMPGDYKAGLKEWSLPCFCK